METKNEAYQTLTEVIRRRQTFKVLGNVSEPAEYSKQVDQAHRKTIRGAIETADWAPFHYDRGSDSVPQPWRFHTLWHPVCRQIAREFPNWFSNVKPNNKLPSMLSACGALVLVNWLPQFSFVANEPDGDPKKRVQVDEEHLAATSAAVQNLLLLLTAAGFGTYWSSGGQFRTPEMFARLQIPERERLLAAVFIEYPESMGSDAERLSGKQRDRRAPTSQWMREIETL